MRTFARTTWLTLSLSLVAGSLHAQPTPDTALYVMPRVDVVGEPQRLGGIPGSASVLDRRSLEMARVASVNEALRKLPGLAVRDEEGFGLRPNVGVRGLNPTRSTKTTLLEDGVPLSYAPYGDNASYYHPPIERYEFVELLKGTSQILFGPQTIGGSINYVTPVPPARPTGVFAATGGSRGYSVARARLGGHRMLLHLTRKEGDGARDHMHSVLHDLSFKTVLPQAVTLRASYFAEDSRITYSGLTQAEYEVLGPRYNPFRNDRFDTRRYGASATHDLPLGAHARLTTNLYYSFFDRDWWRQSSTTTDAQGGPGVVAARNAGARIDPDTIASIQGRLREYTAWGIEPRIRLEARAAGFDHELQAGLKAHVERQDRRQRNGNSPTARTGSLVEDNLRRTRAWSAFLVHRLRRGSWSLTPGVRYEHIRSSRTDRLPGGRSGSDALGQLIPGAGATWNPGGKVTIYAGVHGGFAPPRTEDVIGSAGTATEVGPEESVNWELGTRLAPADGAELQVTAFRNDFRRLIAVGSIAGGSTPLAVGEASFAGAELSGRYRHRSGVHLRGAWTWLPLADQRTAFRQVAGGATVAGSVAGNRQPYAPAHTLTAAAGFSWRGFDGQLEAVHVGPQFADIANTVAPTVDGQRGRLAAHTIWNLALNQRLGSAGATAFVAVKNVADHVYIVDRTRGIQTGAPRLIQVGLHYVVARGR